ncbi:MAG: hypothetical protein JST86_00145 [Bacteroidetes bacterium]|nr:hypothetical protein [Bacteroidota bacterium]
MQQKNLKYLLLAGVAIIWGTVIFRVFSGVNNNTPVIPVTPKTVFKTKDSTGYQPYELLANYDDPFGAGDEKRTLESSTDSLLKTTATFLQNTGSYSGQATVVKPDISFIRYKGIISNSVTHKKAAILSINGKDEFVKANSKLNDIRINIIEKEKILLTYQNEKYWIKRQ